MSALTVERPHSVVEETFGATALAGGSRAGGSTAPDAPPTPVGPPRRCADTPGPDRDDAPREAVLTAVVPPATTPAPRVRLLAPSPTVAAPTATGPAAQVPPTLAARLTVLRATDRSPVLEAVDEDRGPEPAADPAHVARAIAHAVVEVLLGRRPVTQLARWMTPGVYETLQGRAALTARVLGPRAAGRGAAVRRVRVCAVEPHVCEAGVVVDDGVRVRAVALRLETHRGTWRTTSLEVG